MVINSIIRKTMRDRNLVIRDISEATNIPVQRVNQIVLDDAGLTPREAEIILDTLGIKLVDVIGY